MSGTKLSPNYHIPAGCRHATIDYETITKTHLATYTAPYNTQNPGHIEVVQVPTMLLSVLDYELSDRTA